jgi:hypothetical protein
LLDILLKDLFIEITLFRLDLVTMQKILILRNVLGGPAGKETDRDQNENNI